jgi:hypothetical protein
VNLIMQVWRNGQVLSEQSDSSAFLNAPCLLKHVLNCKDQFVFFIFRCGLSYFRINCNRINEGLIYYFFCIRMPTKTPLLSKIRHFVRNVGLIKGWKWRRLNRSMMDAVQGPVKIYPLCIYSSIQSLEVQSDSKLFSGFTWHINESSDNNLESLCIIK